MKMGIWILGMAFGMFTATAVQAAAISAVVTNGSFEDQSGTPAMSPTWTYNKTGDGGIALITTTGHAGTKCVYVCGGGGWVQSTNILDQDGVTPLTIASGTTYRASVWAARENRTYDLNAYIYILADNGVSKTVMATGSLAVGAADASWHQLTCTWVGTAARAGQKLCAKLMTTDGSEYDRLYYDDVTLTYEAAPTNAPNAPSAPTATALSSSRIGLGWTDNSDNELGFKIERSTNGTTFTQVATVDMNVTGYTNTGLTASTKYYYRVRAYNVVGDSVHAETDATTFPAPNAPSALTATAVRSWQINLTWADNSSDEDGFKIESSTNGTIFTQIATVNSNVTAYTNSGLTAQATYYYRVSAYNAGGDSSYSETNNATTPADPARSVGVILNPSFETYAGNQATNWTQAGLGDTWTEIQPHPSSGLVCLRIFGSSRYAYSSLVMEEGGASTLCIVTSQTYIAEVQLAAVLGDGGANRTGTAFIKLMADNGGTQTEVASASRTIGATRIGIDDGSYSRLFVGWVADRCIGQNLRVKLVFSAGSDGYSRADFDMVALRYSKLPEGTIIVIR
jgi:hypothetical protein